MTTKTLTHIDEEGTARMVNVGEKPATWRQAEARAEVHMHEETMAAIKANQIVKGDVLATARIAGINGTKQTAQLIPLCHPLGLEHAEVKFYIQSPTCLEIICVASLTGKTGVEMEAISGVTIAAMTIYDMCKAIDRGMRIHNIRLTRKTGGKSGDFTQA
ncbi:MAG: cyclic pyranopterin monophosphate synthase MoaC [Alphaproteobacteria bacterium]